VIRLTDNDLALASVRAYPANAKGAYSISNGHFEKHHSRYVFQLDAVRAASARAHLVLRFKHNAQPARARAGL
jgi:hypothetical protein